MSYRLLPYIYSLGFWTTLDGYTMMRHLAFDFASDEAVYYTSDQFMFGPAFMVAPIYESGGRRSLYLPRTKGDWVDFFSGAKYQNGTYDVKSFLISFINFQIVVRPPDR